MRTMLELGKSYGLVAAACADTHGHGLTLCSEAEARAFARILETSLTKSLGIAVGFAEVSSKPVLDLPQLYNTFGYVLRQSVRHNLRWDDAFDATNVPDLLGMRLCGAYAQELVGCHLPRVRRVDLLELFDLKTLEPANGPTELFVEATCAAVGRDEIRSRCREARMARRALLEVASGQISHRTLARMIGVSHSSLSRLQNVPVDPRLIRAIRLQLDLRAKLAQRQSPRVRLER
jgi:hypothetical protein